MSISAAKVYLWGEQIGAVAWDGNRDIGTFSYTRDFIKGRLDVAPVHMPISKIGHNRFVFNSLSKDTFSGLPGMLADSLPDKFGSAMINVWLTQNGRASGSMNPVEKLLYIGSRGMGALEYRPAAKGGIAKSEELDLDSLVKLANDIMQQKESLAVNTQDQDALLAILHIGTSAGGARPKGIVAIDSDFKRMISGHAKVPSGYEHWIIKFDGVSDMELGMPQDFGRIEYAYHLMAKDAGINMTECKLWEENGRAHFMTKRFDRIGNEKIHMQSLCAIAHYDFNMARAYSYEQAMMVGLKIGLSKLDIQQLFRRMVFNILTRNQDDHTKNISFIMDKEGSWSLSPAYDVTYSHNPAGVWTNQHQMSVNGKTDDFTLSDIMSVAKNMSIPNAKVIYDAVLESTRQWETHAKAAELLTAATRAIRASFRKL